MSAANAPSPAASPDTFAADPANAGLTANQKLGFLRQMLRIRRFEQASLKLYQQGKMGGFLHLYIGQESVAVGTCSLLGPNDHCITAYRDHGHALVVGMAMDECMAELLGKATGCSKGKGGSMHFFAPDKNFWGGHGIVAGQTPTGLGIAYALKYRGLAGCCLAYLGDGAVNQGVFHESLNIAALWQIPVIYIIENNRYAMGTAVSRASAQTDFSQRGLSFNIPGIQVDGMDVRAVKAAADEATAFCRAGKGPIILEMLTYRYRGHSMSDPAKYRSKDEVQKMRSDHDPIEQVKARLLEKGWASEDELKQIDKNVRDIVADSADFAQADPEPDVSELYTDILA